MKPIWLTALISFAVITGCSSVAIYETEKISITLESRGDVSQPVSANIGLKQRVALIVPGKKETSQTISDNTDALAGITAQQKAGEDAASGKIKRRSSPGEAVSAVSYFNFDYDAGSAVTIFDNKTLIETVLLTGNASPKACAPEIFKVISAPARSTRFNLTRIANASLMYDGLKQMKRDGDDTSGKLVEALDKLHSILPEKYPFTLYYPVPETSNDFRVQGKVNAGEPINTDGTFFSVTGYIGKLNDAISVLEEMIITTNLKINGDAKIPESTFKDGLKAKKTELEKLREEKNLELYGNPIFQSAFNYYIKMLKE
jgi:hypothetical protein